MKKLLLIMILSLLLLLSGACTAPVEEELTPIKFMLDWVPNTNHTGIFIAQDKGYFKDSGLDVTIIQPGEVYPEAAVASGAVDFGVSFQEWVTLSRADDIPVVSIAAILQHNTSGFASITDLNVKSAADFEGLRYGSYGTPFEYPTLEVLMKCAGADFDKLEIVNIGFADPLALLAEKQIDLAWIFYGWQGIQAQQNNIDLNIVMFEDNFDCIPDYYTPVVIASEDTISNRPEVVRDVCEALSRGYNFAVENPSEAADILVSAVPELDAEMVQASQTWLSQYYKADASRWGEQKESVWQNYTDWMLEHDILESPISASDAFTNEFLP